MSYIIDRFNEGEVKFQDGAAGWLFDSGEFRPLMDDAMAELLDADLVSQETVDITRNARDIYVEKSLQEYVRAQAARSPEQIAEEQAMARAALGDVPITNIITGETF